MEPFALDVSSPTGQEAQSSNAERESLAQPGTPEHKGGEPPIGDLLPRPLHQRKVRHLMNEANPARQPRPVMPGKNWIRVLHLLGHYALRRLAAGFTDSGSLGARVKDGVTARTIRGISHRSCQSARDKSNGSLKAASGHRSRRHSGQTAEVAWAQGPVAGSSHGEPAARFAPWHSRCKTSCVQ